MPELFRYLNNYRFQSIFFKYLFILILGFALPLTASVYLVSRFGTDIARSEILNAYRSNLVRIRDTVNAIVYEGELMAIRLADHSSVRDFLAIRPESHPDYDQIDLLGRVQNLIVRPPGNYIHSIYLYNEAADLVLSSNGNPTKRGGMEDSSWYQLYREGERDRPIRYAVRASTESRTEEDAKEFLSILCRAPQFTGSPAGLVVVNIDIGKIRTEIIRSGTGEETFIVTPDLELMLPPHPDELQKRYEDTRLGHRFPLTYDVDSRSFVLPDVPEPLIGESLINKDWWVFTSITLEGFENRLGRIWQFGFLIIAGGLLFTLVIALFISVGIYSPFKNIIGLLEHPEAVTLARLNEPLRRFDEVGYITDNILKSLDRSRRMEADLLDKMVLLRQAQTTALQTQINPHFLYNALHSIAVLSRDARGGDTPVTESVLALSRMLRTSLDTEGNFISLRQELEHARSFLRIMELQSKDMRVDWDVDPALLDILVPKIILQPLIENAVYHGLKPKGGTGMIKIELRGDDASVFIHVSDDGVGMEAAELATLRTSFKDRSIGSEKIGLRNVNLRLLLLLGEDFELTVDSTQGQGTTVRIRFPRIE